MGEAKLFHFVTERVAADVQELGSLDLVSVGLLESELDERVLYILE